MRVVSFVVVGVLILAGTAWIATAEGEGQSDFLLGLRTEGVEVSPQQRDAVTASIDSKPRWQVRVRATFLRVDAAAADDVLGEYRPAREGSAQAIPGASAQRLLAGARGQGSIRPEPLPPLVLGQGVTGRLSSSGLHTYVQDYDGEDGIGIPRGSPIIGQLEDGARVDVTPRRTSEGLMLEMRLAWAEVIRPVPVFESGSTSQVTRIELPELKLLEQRNEIDLPKEGGYVLAGRGLAWDTSTVRVAVLEVSVEQ